MLKDNYLNNKKNQGLLFSNRATDVSEERAYSSDAFRQFGLSLTS